MPGAGGKGSKDPASGVSDFVVVANRLPIDMERLPDGSTRWKRSPGGLVTALEPLLRRRRGAWIGWPGVVDDEVDVEDEPIVQEGLRLHPVRLSADDVEEYYEGFSNATLWPLYHDVIVKPSYHREWWDRYVTSTSRFAKAASRAAAERGHRLGAGLSAATGPENAARTPARSDDRVLFAHPVPARRAVHADALADRDRGRPTGRRLGGIPAGRRCAEFPDSVPTADRREHLARFGRGAVALR